MNKPCSPDKHAWEFTGMILTSAPPYYAMNCTKCGCRYNMPEKEYKSFDFMKKLEENGIIGIIK